MTTLQSIIYTLGLACSVVLAVICLVWLCCAGFSEDDQ